MKALVYGGPGRKSWNDIPCRSYATRRTPSSGSMR